MPRRVEIVSKKRVFDKFFKIDEVVLRFETFKGTMSAPITRLSLERGDSAAAVVHNEAAKTLLLIEQFRYPAFEKGPGWLLELPAGVVEHGEDPKKTMARELEEEIGYHVASLKHISTFYLSPGGTSERIHLYYAKVQPDDKKSSGGGLATENEDIRTVEVKIEDVYRKMDNGEIADAKTLIGLQWLRLQKS